MSEQSSKEPKPASFQQDVKLTLETPREARRNFLQEIHKSDPEIARELAFSLAREICKRPEPEVWLADAAYDVADILRHLHSEDALDTLIALFGYETWATGESPLKEVLVDAKSTQTTQKVLLQHTTWRASNDVWKGISALHLLDVLGRRRDPLAIPRLVDLIKSPKERIEWRCAACALARFDTPETREVFQHILDDPSCQNDFETPKILHALVHHAPSPMTWDLLSPVVEQRMTSPKLKRNADHILFELASRLNEHPADPGVDPRWFSVASDQFILERDNPQSYAGRIMAHLEHPEKFDLLLRLGSKGPPLPPILVLALGQGARPEALEVLKKHLLFKKPELVDRVVTAAQVLWSYEDPELKQLVLTTLCSWLSRAETPWSIGWIADLLQRIGGKEQIKPVQDAINAWKGRKLKGAAEKQDRIQATQRMQNLLEKLKRTSQNC